MNWSRCSRVALAVALVLVVAAGPVAAVESDANNLPEETNVDTTTDSSFTLTELYSDYKQWTLRANTDLTNVTWTVVEYNAADERIAETSYDGQSFNHTVDIESDTTRIEVEVTGTVPTIENYTYQPPEQYTYARFQQVREGGTKSNISEYEVYHYTTESKEARQTIDEAKPVVNDSDSDEAQKQLQRAINAYNAGNFELAIDLAQDAQKNAEQARESQQRTQTFLYAGIGVLVLLVVVGGVFYWRSQQDDYDKLR